MRQIGTAAIQMGTARMGLDQAGQHCRRPRTNWTVSTCSSHSPRNRRRSMTERIDVLHQCKGASRARQVTEAWWRDRCRTSVMAMACPYLKAVASCGLQAKVQASTAGCPQPWLWLGIHTATAANALERLEVITHLNPSGMLSLR